MQDDPLSVRLKIVLGPDARLGPGKMALLDGIARTGSISAAGRELGMSYRRAWLLVEAVNTMFSESCVTASAGGVHGGGAALTPFGRDLLEAYRRLVSETDARAEAIFGRFRPLARRTAAPRSG